MAAATRDQRTSSAGSQEAEQIIRRGSTSQLVQKWRDKEKTNFSSSPTQFQKHDSPPVARSIAPALARFANKMQMEAKLGALADNEVRIT